MNSPTLAPSAAVPSATGAGGTTTVPDVLAGDSSGEQPGLQGRQCTEVF